MFNSVNSVIRLAEYINKKVRSDLSEYVAGKIGKLLVLHFR